MAGPVQQHDPLLGQVLDGRFEIMERLGEGGMGVVYKARQVGLGRVVALKMLNQQMAKDPNWVKRFNNEARACSQLQHPNTIRMYDFGQTRDGRLFMTMEFLDGMSLRAAIANGAPMDPARVVKILIQCCASLAEAHAVGIIHRDIKPDNVFLLSMAGSPDFVKLLDFSVAKLLQENDKMRTQAGIVFGTPQYMSPEQGRGMPLDARSDLYALGILAYEMLTGRVPFNDDNPMTVLQMHLRQAVDPLPPSVPPPVQALVMTALSKDPGNRFQSAGEMMQACQQLAQQLAAGGVGMAAPASASAGDRTMIAGHTPPPQFGAAGAGSGRTPVPSTASPEQKTMIAGQAPNVADLLRQQQQGHNPVGPATADAKTVVAGVNPLLAGGGPQQQQGPSAGPPQSGGHQSGGQKTVMLADSEGIISMAQAATGSGGNMGYMGHPGAGGHMGHGPSSSGMPRLDVGDHTGSTALPGEDEGAGVGFWILCLVAGLAVGVLAYLVVLQLS